VYRVGLALFLFFLSLFSIYEYAVQFIGESQLEFFIERIYDNESYNIRVPIWINVIDYVLTHPKVLLFGVGPDVSIRESKIRFFDQLFSYRGLREQAVDSNYLTFILNYGIVLSALFFYKITSVLWVSFGSILNNKLYRYLLVFPVLSWLIIGITQLHGISKPGFLIIFYVAISGSLLPKPIAAAS